MTITALPAAPSRADTPATFILKANAFVAALQQLVTEVNATVVGFNVTMWISGTTYAIGDLVWSPTSYQTYRRKTAGAGTTDPASDTTNYAITSETYGLTVVASGATPDIWTGTTPVVSYIGTATATGFANAPVAGMTRTLVATGACSFTAGANLVIAGALSGTTLTLAANDVVKITAITTSQFLISIVNVAGEPVSKLFPVGATVAGNAMTLTLDPCVIDFRSATLGSGVVNHRRVRSQISTVISSGSTAGTVSGVPSRIIILAIDVAGTIELAWVNANAPENSVMPILDEAATISTTAEGGAGAADSYSTIYSTTSRSNVPFRIVGVVESTQGTAGLWTIAPSLVQGGGGGALSIGRFAQTHLGQYISMSGMTGYAWYFPTTGLNGIRQVTMSFVGLSTNGTSVPIIQLRAAPGGWLTSGYVSSAGGVGAAIVAAAAFTTGFGICSVNAAAATWQGTITLTLADPLNNVWVASGTMARTDTPVVHHMAGMIVLNGLLDAIMLTTVAGVDTADSGLVSVAYRY